MLKNIDSLTIVEIASLCDHTFLNRSEAYREKAGKGESPVRMRQKAFEDFLSAAVSNPIQPYALCVRPEDVRFTNEYLKKHNSSMVIASVVGFPDGSWYNTELKIAEALMAIADGAKEIDMVLNIDKFKSGKMVYVENEIFALTDLCHKSSALLKLIFETSELSDDEIIKVCDLSACCGVDFVKTSTGFGSAGAKAEHLTIMRDNFNGGVKMSGGVKKDNVFELLRAVSGRDDGQIELDSLKVRIGESSLLKELG